MELEIYAAEGQVGTLRITQRGLYLDCEAVCRPTQGGVLRLYGWKGDDCACLGVPVPEGDALVLRRRFSAAGLPFLPEQALLGQAFDGWLPWRGQFCGTEIPLAWRRTGPEALLALPQSMAIPERLTERQAGTLQLGGEEWRLLSEMMTQKPMTAPKAAAEKAEEGDGFLASLEMTGETEATMPAETEATEADELEEDRRRFHREIL